MAKDELGTKRVCPVTGRKFYDLNKDPIISPYTGESYPRSVFDPIANRLAGARGTAVRAAAAAAPAAEEVEVEEAGDVELVPLEDVEEDAGKTVTSEEDIELEDEALDDETFLEEEEEGDDDLSDVIGDVEDDEER